MVRLPKLITGLILAALFCLPRPLPCAEPAKQAPAPAKSSPAAPAKTVSTAVMELKETAHDFGTIMEGQSVEHVFMVTNTGKENLVIQSVKPG